MHANSNYYVFVVDGSFNDDSSKEYANNVGDIMMERRRMRRKRIRTRRYRR